MSRIKSWILAGCAASSLFALGASKPAPSDTGRFSVTIAPMTAESDGLAVEGGRIVHGTPVVPFSVYHPEAVSYPRDAIAAAGEAP